MRSKGIPEGMIGVAPAARINLSYGYFSSPGQEDLQMTLRASRSIRSTSVWMTTSSPLAFQEIRVPDHAIGRLAELVGSLDVSGKQIGHPAGP